jgi:hypothetical protein
VTCHAPVQLRGLHRVPQHAACESCHLAHDAKPRGDRASCLVCHRDREHHEPTAATCTGCHPFGNGV